MHTASLISIPRELHLALISYLSSSDIAALGQTHPLVRPIYTPASWKHCSLNFSKSLFNPRERAVPFEVFFRPHRYSWFCSHAVYTANLLFRKAGYETDQLLANFSHDAFLAAYPNLRRLKWRIFIGKSDHFAQLLIPILLIPNTHYDTHDFTSGEGYSSLPSPSLSYSTHLVIQTPCVFSSLEPYGHAINHLEFSLLSPYNYADVGASSSLVHQHFPNLCTFIFRCPHTLTTEHGYMALVNNIARGLKHLHSLTLTNCYFTRPFLLALATLPADIPFCKISFRDYETVTDDALEGEESFGLLSLTLSLPQITYLCENSGPYFLRYPVLLKSLTFPRLRSIQMLENDISCFSLLISNPKVPIFTNVTFLDIQVNNYDAACLLVHILQCCQNLSKARILRAMSPSHFAFANSFENSTTASFSKISPPESKNTISEILKFIRLNFLEDILDLDQSKYNYSMGIPVRERSSKKLYYEKKALLEAKIKESIPPAMRKFERLFMLLGFILDPFGTRYSASLEDIRVYWIQLCSCGYWERLGSALMGCTKLEYAELGYSDTAFRRERELAAVCRSDIRPLDCPRFHHFVASHAALKQLVLVNCATHHVHAISKSEEAEAYSFGGVMKKASRWSNNQVDLVTIIDKEAQRCGYSAGLQRNEKLDYYILPEKWREYKAGKAHTPEVVVEGLDCAETFAGWK